ncbi:MAG: hypothetical protein QM662_05310, partial [Gordonia sp. (in: high G+C Gram-positive bacteria)]
MAAGIAASISDLRFQGPEAELWRQKARAHIESIDSAARGIQLAGDGLGFWRDALSRAQALMAPVLSAAHLDYGNLVRAFDRVIAAEAFQAAATSAVVVAKAHLDAAVAASAATGGAASPAVATASAHLSQALAEQARAVAEVAAAYADHQGAQAKWSSTKSEAASIQSQLGLDAHAASSQIGDGTGQATAVQQSVSDARSTVGTAQSAASTAAAAVQAPAQMAQSMTGAMNGGGNHDSSTSQSTNTNASTQPGRSNSDSSAGDGSGAGGTSFGMPTGQPGGAKSKDDKKKDDKKDDRDQGKDESEENDLSNDDDQGTDAAETSASDDDHDSADSTDSDDSPGSGDESGGGDIAKTVSDLPQKAMGAATSVGGVLQSLAGQITKKQANANPLGAVQPGTVLVPTAQAPSKYIYPLTIPAGARAVVNPDGSASVVNLGGQVVADIPAPTAMDARGADQKTWFEVNGNGQLVQHFDPAKDAGYPLVAGEPASRGATTPATADPLQQVAQGVQTAAQVTSSAQQAVQAPM